VHQVIQKEQRDRRLLDLLTEYHTGSNRVIVFVLYKKEADRMEQFLRRNEWQCVCVHGDKRQHDRERAINQFAEGSCALLVATDVATRGLDIADVEYVINYSFPLTVEDYIHRYVDSG
jgi:ATP-dependent RNA helicase DBP3